MPSEATPHLLHLMTDAALKSFWRKQTLRNFLRRCGISQSALSSWAPEETKRDFLDRLLPLVERSPKASLVISHMARTLAEQASFPDLDNWEDSAEKKRQATEAVNALRQYLAKQQESAEQDRDRLETQGRVRAIQERSRLQRQTLSSLEDRLRDLSGQVRLPDLVLRHARLL
jgi:septal ring factor EnvC (AmiA/AmiB activator)